MKLKMDLAFVGVLIAGTALAAIGIWRVGWPSTFSDTRTMVILLSYSAPLFSLAAIDKTLSDDTRSRVMAIITSLASWGMLLWIVAFPGDITG